MTTKPEGPAQEPQCKRCNGTGVVRPAADDCARCGGTGIEPVPATAAPSYPSELPASKLSWPQLPEPSARAVEAARRIIHFFRANPRVMRETVVGRIIDDVFESAPSQLQQQVGVTPRHYIAGGQHAAEQQRQAASTQDGDEQGHEADGEATDVPEVPTPERNQADAARPLDGDTEVPLLRVGKWEHSEPVTPATPAPSQPLGADDPDLFRKQRDWLIKECERIGVTVNVLIGEDIRKAYRLSLSALSQPAGAREWAEQIVSDVFPSMDAACAVRYIEQVAKRLTAFAAQQTAAKDAEIADLRRQRDLEWDSRKAASSGRIAAQRERDSLRERVRECLFIAESGKPTDESFTLGVIVAKLQEADAALKAGKDGQK